MIHEQQASAQIYQFPVGGRSGVFSTLKRPVFSEAASPRDVHIQTSDSWYHAEAITAAAKDFKPV